MRARHGSVIVSAFAAALPGIGQAHHAMDSATPANALEGLISGLAHPVIGPDHFLFVLAIGVACYYFHQRAASVAAFLAAAAAGTVLHLYRATLPYPDAWVALSLVILGLLLVRAAPVLRSRVAPALFALSGIAHGYAYGEAIVGAEQAPLFAYIAGFTMVQFLIVLAGYMLARYVDRKRLPFAPVKAMGGALSIAGAAFLLLSLAA
jgi:urease accessory protein